MLDDMNDTTYGDPPAAETAHDGDGAADYRTDPPEAGSGPHSPAPAPSGGDLVPATVVPEGATVVHVDPARSVLGLPSPNEWAAITGMAQALSRSGLVPSTLRGKPDDVALVLLTGRDLMIAPTMALGKVHPINGRPTMAAELMIALARRAGHKVWDDDGNDHRKATIYLLRNDDPDHVHSFTFTWEDAERATYDEWTGSGNNRRKVTKKLVEKDNYQNWPQFMMWSRAASGLVRHACPEVLLGVTYTPDELGAVEGPDGVIEISPDDYRPASARTAEPEQPPEPAPDEWKQAMRARFDALPDPAKAEVTSAWRERNKDREREAMPPVRDALARHVAWWEALIDSFEKRAERGEWGDWNPPVQVEGEPRREVDTRDPLMAQAETALRSGDTDDASIGAVVRVMIEDGIDDPQDGDGAGDGQPDDPADDAPPAPASWDDIVVAAKASHLSAVRRELDARGIDYSQMDRDTMRAVLAAAWYADAGGELDDGTRALLDRYLPHGEGTADAGGEDGTLPIG